MLMFFNTKELHNMSLTACSMLMFSNTKEIINMTLIACSMLMFSNTKENYKHEFDSMVMAKSKDITK